MDSVYSCNVEVFLKVKMFKSMFQMKNTRLVEQSCLTLLNNLASIAEKHLDT